MTTKRIPADVADGLTGLFFLIWFCLPVTSGPLPLHAPLSPWFLPIAFLKLAPFSFQSVLLFLVYLVPLYGLLKTATLFKGVQMGVYGAYDSLFSGIGRIAATSIMIMAADVPVLAFAESPAYFQTYPLTGYLFTLLAVVGNIMSVVLLMSGLNLKNAAYCEYKAFKKNQKQNALVVPGPKASSLMELLFKIRSKLFFAFIGIISVILLVLSFLLLGNYRTTILEAVGDGARGQVEQASANYRVNLGDSIALFEYFNRQAEQNAKADFRYDNLAIYTERKDDIYVDSPASSIPDFKAEYSTLSQGVQYPEIPPIGAASAKTYINSYAATKDVVSLHDSKARTFSYISPIIKIDTIRKGQSQVKRERVLGFSVMTFDEDIIMRPYFMTRNMVIIITAFFMYLSVILTYLVGNYIVNPLLYLRMNVRKISDILNTMIRGESRVSAATLVYNDCVTSRDEIKSLSTEINEMVTVIRGIVPYISASTLKQAEKGIASSINKEMTFLFTDIRGFTTLCEGMEPDQVVGILNQYLDLETEIILNNHGDVDKFVGDEMMASFEGPNKEINACRAAMQIRHAMMEEKERREKEGLPVVAIGIGINTGPVIFGSVGARDRMDFTSIGDTVNLAARLEGANKAYGSKTIITEAVYNQVQEKFLCRELDFIAVKGKTEPVRIYEILQEIPKAQPKLVKIKELFEAGLPAYRERKWKVAAAAFKKNVELYNDSPSAVYLERIEHFIKNPPADDWDGVFRMTVK